MPVELRKRKAPPPPPEPPAKKATKAKTTKAVAATKAAAEKVKEVATKVTKTAAAAATTNGNAKKPEVGDVISLEGFGGEIETNDGQKTTLKALVDESKAGVVIFTYPKASTPGCTRQACLFRDNYTSLSTDSGFAIYGLSKDSTTANTNFKTKQSLPYPLLCDPASTLISAIGLKKAPNGITRGVFVVDKSGKVLAAGAGSPEGTVNVVKGIVESLGAGEGDVEKVEEKVEEKVKEGEEKAEKVEEAEEANGKTNVEEKKEEEEDGDAKMEDAVAEKNEETKEADKKEEEESKEE
ncbi:peroxiredoxin DOT5 [Podospora fimiseda]|uniref:thioredoxin-dependent peroxiredoxin n=1 Tax=Podospora fimiseda TaxID=252190 RepID=A0AAN7BJK2_9PEZI|nr:peroxiredoxin DOT5 [Podospora fimiseda]